MKLRIMGPQRSPDAEPVAGAEQHDAGASIAMILTVGTSAAAALVLIWAAVQMGVFSSITVGAADGGTEDALLVEEAYGKWAENGSLVLRQLMVPAPGAREVDLSKVSLAFSWGSENRTFRPWSIGSDPAVRITVLRDSDGSVDEGMVTRGDLIEVTVTLGQGSQFAQAPTLQENVGVDGGPTADYSFAVPKDAGQTGFFRLQQA